MSSLQQENTNLVSHLKNSDFFDVERYPKSTVKITRIANGIAYGQLTIKNNTRPLQCPVTISYHKTGLEITGKITLDRTQFGIVYNSNKFFASLGDKAIKNTFDVEFHLFGSGPLPEQL